jgi:hypothetical protein
MISLTDLLKHRNYFAHKALAMKRPELKQIETHPIFVVGCGHSGTTLLLRILGAHPNIHPILDESAAFSKQRTYLLRDFDMEALKVGKKRWVEKTPLHIHHIETIFNHRPQARVLVIVRDGRDVATSIKDRKGDVLVGIKRWVRDNTAAEPFRNDPRVMFLKYEDLVANFDEEVGKILQFLGEHFTEDVKNYHSLVKHETLGHQRPPSAAGDNHLEYRMWQVTQPLFDGRNRWVNVFSEEEKSLFKTHAGEMLVRYGYAADDQW